MKTVIALDVSKGHSIVVAYDEFKNLLFERRIMHTRSNFNTLKEMINQLKKEYEQSPEIVFEATGVYSRGLERFLQDHDLTYSLINPLEANFQTQSLRRNKTDKSDAHELAKTHFKVKRRVTTPQDSYYHTMRIMSRRYDNIENEKNLYKNRLHALLQLSFPEIETIFKTKTTACRLIGEIGDINRFKSNKQLNAYVGIDIARYQSGNTHYKDRINKRGNRRLRSMLFFMIVSMLSAKGKNTNHITNYYYKLKEQPYNKHHKVAVIACVNKFLKIAFHLIQHNILYDYEIASPNS